MISGSGRSTDAREQPVHHHGVPQVAVHDILARPQRLERGASAGRTQVDAALQQRGAQKPS
jgi:hypothetical protein